MSFLTNRYALIGCLALALSGCEQYPPQGDQAVWENVDYAQLSCPNGGTRPGCAYRAEDDSPYTGIGAVGNGHGK